jgi:hypothetical protein
MNILFLEIVTLRKIILSIIVLSNEIHILVNEIYIFQKS